MIYDTAVIIPTVLRPQLARAVHSVFDQDFDGTVQIVLGVDVNLGDAGMVDGLRRDCPANMTLAVLDPGFSTSARNGGYYRIWAGGALRTILSYAASSHRLAYLDDDNWWAPGHLSDLVEALDGHAWAYTYRWYVHPQTLQVMCVDEWESVGPDRGMYADKYGGFVDTNCYMIDKRKCHWQLPAWCVPDGRVGKGEGEDKVMLSHLRSRGEGACTGNATVYYVIKKSSVKIVRRLMQQHDQAGRG